MRHEVSLSRNVYSLDSRVDDVCESCASTIRWLRHSRRVLMGKCSPDTERTKEKPEVRKVLEGTMRLTSHLVYPVVPFLHELDLQGVCTLRGLMCRHKTGIVGVQTIAGT